MKRPDRGYVIGFSLGRPRLLLPGIVDCFRDHFSSILYDFKRPIEATMALVDYSDSDNSVASNHSTKKTQDKSRKRKRTTEHNSSLPPLPDTFHDLYASTTRLSNQDDPTLHAGRQRAIPHIEGNWPTHVYIECMFSLSHPPAHQTFTKAYQNRGHPSTEHSLRLQTIITSLFQISSSSKHQITSLLPSHLNASLPTHISLSAPITLQTHQRDPFIDILTTNIRKSNLRP